MEGRMDGLFQTSSPRPPSIHLHTHLFRCQFSLQRPLLGIRPVLCRRFTEADPQTPLLPTVSFAPDSSPSVTLDLAEAETGSHRPSLATLLLGNVELVETGPTPTQNLSRHPQLTSTSSIRRVFGSSPAIMRRPRCITIPRVQRGI